ncbi:MAG: aldolase/citrate lyase family protein [Deltaproteobacteria bacterium]|nr:aldolase/citrate lyase family protein [Deltaproteobacteria bacterium]
MYPNLLKLKLKKGYVCFGTFIRLGPGAVEIFGHCGWDFVVLDMEHGVFDFPQVEHMIRASRLAGITSLVRVPEPNPSYIMRVLDAGAEGVQIPQVETAEMARTVAQAARYHPQGKRGLCSFVRAAGYSTVLPDEHMATSNNEVLTVVHIEGERAASEIKAIVETPGIDVIFLGPWDLSQSLGVPGKTRDPRVVEVMEKVIQTCIEKGIASGTFVRDIEDAKHWIKKGVQYMMHSTDAGLLVQVCRERLETLRNMPTQK